MLNMMPPLRGVVLAALALLFSTAAARADKYVYTDVQFIVLVPTNTALAPYTSATLTQANAAADALITASNNCFDRGQRGLRYRRCGNVAFVTAADVGDSDDADTINDIDNLFHRPGESDNAWYNRAFLLPYTLAPARPTEWKYRTDMANFYLLPGTGGGIGSVSNQNATNENIIIQGHFGVNPGVHELAHWTGHASRLGRDYGQRFGDHAYAVEELTAELAAAILTGRYHIANVARPDHAKYLKHWLEVLVADPRHLFSIATRAQAAVDHITSYSQTKTAEPATKAPTAS